MYARFLRSYHQPLDPAFRPWRSNWNRYGNSRRSRLPRFRDSHYYHPNPNQELPPEDEEPESQPPTFDALNVLHVEDVDFNIKVNTKKHHTDKYEKTEDRFNDDGEKETAKLVVRRGQEFLITLNMDRPYDKERDDLRLVFRIGKNPLPNKGTEVVLNVKETGYPSVQDITSWKASILSITYNDVKLSVYPAANCIIGKWDFAVQTVFKEEDGSVKGFEYDEPDNIYIILNPFCKDDTVYMETQGLLDEYILNDHGGLWRGEVKHPTAKPWFFGQFEDGILDASLHLLRKGYGLKITRQMSDPVKICRMLSRMVNAQDDEGVVVGNWTHMYYGGHAPDSWSGSVAILLQYLATKNPVKFGQCWVFSGVLTTVCRAVGIPCRSITNFESAHNRSDDATIDRYCTPEGKLVDSKDFVQDNIWNFHVWNDVWMSRPDLPKGYDGWQALDATPQEKSDGFYQCGPFPVAAIRKGQVWLPHDGTFIFSEVNGHVVQYVVGLTGVNVNKVDTKRVGQKLSTKDPNGKPFGTRPPGASADHPDRLDCTHLYKPPEGSKDEALVQETVKRFVGKTASFEGLSETIAILVDDIGTLMAGKDFNFKCTLRNLTCTDCTLDILIIVKITTYYTSVGSETIKQMDYQGERLRSGRSAILHVPITVADYLDKLHGEDVMNIEVGVRVHETGETYTKEEQFTFDHHELIITPKGPYAVDKPFDVLLEIQNPLSIPLTGLSVRLEGPGLRGNGKLIEPKQKTIAAFGTLKESVTLTPKRPGKKTITASFDCKELPDITGQAEIEIPARATYVTE